MKMRCYFSLLSSVMSAAVLLASVASAQGRQGTVAPAPCSQDLAGVILPDLNNPATLRPFAWHLLSHLVGTGPNNFPMWEGWSTKDNIGLEPHPLPTTSIAQRFTITSPHGSNNAQSNLLANLRPPVQTEGVLSRSQGTSLKPDSSHLSSVHYNKTAADYIKKNLVGFHAHGIDLKLECGSMITKAIWATVDRSSPVINVSQFTSSSESDWPRVVPALGLSRPGAPGAETPPGWTIVALDPAATLQTSSNPCMPNQDPSKPPAHVSFNCFHHYQLAKDTNPQQQFPPNTFSVGECMNQCALALVGLQLMVRTEASQPWVWISFWWSGRDQTSTLPADVKLSPPWNYYEMVVTNTDRDGHAGAGMNILFNPYLEGLSTNGRVSNCLTCHRNASANPTNRKESMVLCGAGVSIGDPVPPQASTGAASMNVLTRSAQYLATVTPTDSVWSLAGVPPPPSHIANAAMIDDFCRPFVP